LTSVSLDTKTPVYTARPSIRGSASSPHTRNGQTNLSLKREKMINLWTSTMQVDTGDSVMLPATLYYINFTTD